MQKIITIVVLICAIAFQVVAGNKYRQITPH